MRTVVSGGRGTQFKFLIGDVNWLDYGAKWISTERNNGDWPYRMILELINMHEATGDEKQPKYAVELRVVSPQAAGEVNVKKAADGYSEVWLENLPPSRRELMRYEMLDDYGVSAILFQETGNNARSLIRQARLESSAADCLFGLYMDRPLNKIGTTGWDAIAGNILAPLGRQKGEVENEDN